MTRPLAPALWATLVILGAAPALSQSSGQPTPAIEVLVVVRDQAPRCEPQELRVPAETNVDLRIQNQGGRPAVFKAGEWFKEDQVRGMTNMTREANGGGYTVAPGQQGQMIVRTPQPGQYPFTCADQAMTLTSAK